MDVVVMSGLGGEEMPQYAHQTEQGREIKMVLSKERFLTATAKYVCTQSYVIH